MTSRNPTHVHRYEIELFVNVAGAGAKTELPKFDDTMHSHLDRGMSVSATDLAFFDEHRAAIEAIDLSFPHAPSKSEFFDGLASAVKKATKNELTAVATVHLETPLGWVRVGGVGWDPKATPIAMVHYVDASGKPGAPLYRVTGSAGGLTGRAMLSALLRVRRR
ncbi:MAG: hypothetical protein IPH13_10710 [Planctomycetes bacterium]|nr:hypothetical protein [Planctomycetota bacterium]